MASTLEPLKRLTEGQVDFVLVGGFAAAAHGSSMVTEDVDVCIEFDLPTLTRLLEVVAPLHPRQRMTPEKSPLERTAEQLVGSRNLYLLTDAGQLDLLGEITGVGRYRDLVAGAVQMDLGGFHCRVMGLEDLIRAKRALGRPKDLRTAIELELVLERLQHAKPR